MLTSNVCYFDYFLRKKGVSEQLSKELQDMRIGLDRFELLGLRDGKAISKVSYIEQLYVDSFRKSLQNNSRYIVLHQWYIDGIECDIIIKDSSTGTIVANIEIDGVHHSKPRKQRSTKLRDEYLTAHHGIRVVRVDVMVRMNNQDSLDAGVSKLLKDVEIDL
jgi:very-short-patch-repair endonuclease